MVFFTPINFRTLGLAGGLALAGWGLGPATVTAADISYSGKDVAIIIPFASGGGTDVVGRMLGQFMVKYLPGNPTLIVRNMPGAGGITGMNFFVSDRVSPDGTTMSLGAAAQVDSLLYKSAASRYDGKTLRYVGGVNRGGNALIIASDAIARIKDPKAEPIVMGTTDGTATGMVMAMWGREFAGWNFRWVHGYPGTVELMLALQRGEIHMTATANMAQINELIAGGKHQLWAQSGNLENGQLKPQPNFRGAPLLMEVISPNIKTDLERKAIDYWEGTSAMDKFLVLPPTAPDDVLKVYRDAFLKVTKDPDFVSQGKKLISEEFEVVMPEDQEKMALKLASADEDTMRYIDSIRVKQGLRTMFKDMK